MKNNLFYFIQLNHSFGLAIFALNVLFLIELNASAIPESALVPLKTEMDSLLNTKKSSTSKRRIYKNVIRKSQALIKSSPKAVNRFAVHGLILKAQNGLLRMDNFKRNQEAFYETCEALMESTDAYVGLRLNAEFLLSERDLTAKDADASERIMALIKIVKGYRGTDAELKSLISAISRTPRLNALELREELIKSVAQRFSSDPVAIAFLRKLSGSS